MRLFKKILHTAIDVFLYGVIIVTAIVLLGNLLGYHSYVVLSGSMEPVIHTGSVIVVNENIAYDDIVVGDVIAFKQAGLATQVTHRAISITPEGIETKGDNNDFSDGITTTRENFVGKSILTIPFLGYFIQWLSSGKSVGIPFLTINRILTVFGFIVLFLIQSLLEDPPEEEENEDKEKGKKLKIPETKELPEAKQDQSAELAKMMAELEAMKAKLNEAEAKNETIRKVDEPQITDNTQDNKENIENEETQVEPKYKVEVAADEDEKSIEQMKSFDTLEAVAVKEDNGQDEEKKEEKSPAAEDSGHDILFDIRNGK